MQPQPDDYDSGWRADLYEAAGELVAAIDDITHHEIGDGWDIGTDPAYEIDRLRRRCDQLDAAVREARAGVARVERRARLAAVRRTRAEKGRG